MGLEFARHVCVFLEISAIGMTIAEQHVHDGAGERAIGARANDHLHIGLLHRARLIDIDTGDPGAALFPRESGVGHHIDLRIHRVGAPDDDQIGFLHLARIGSGHPAAARDIAGPRQGDTESVIQAGIVLGMAQAIDAISHNEAHGAGIVIGPNRKRPVTGFSFEERIGHFAHRIIPGQALPLAIPFGALALQGMEQPIRMVDALGIAPDLLADDAQRIGIIFCAAHPPDRVGIEELDIEGAGRGTVMRADRSADLDIGPDVHVRAYSAESAEREICEPSPCFHFPLC